MKLISLAVAAVALVSFADAYDASKCNLDYVGKRTPIDNVVHSFQECHPKYEEMGTVLTKRFLAMSPAQITMKFFKWITIVALPQDYKAAGADCFFNIMLGLPIPPFALQRLSDDKVNWNIMKNEIIPDNSIISSDLKKDPIKSAITISVSVNQLAATIYQTLAPVCGRMLTDPSTTIPMVTRIVGIIRTVAGEVAAGKDGGLGKVVEKSGLGPKLAKIGRIVFGPYPIEDGFWAAEPAPAAAAPAT